MTSLRQEYQSHPAVKGEDYAKGNRLVGLAMRARRPAFCLTHEVVGTLNLVQARCNATVAVAKFNELCGIAPSTLREVIAYDLTV